MNIIRLSDNKSIEASYWITGVQSMYPSTNKVNTTVFTEEGEYLIGENCKWDVNYEYKETTNRILVEMTNDDKKELIIKHFKQNGDQHIPEVLIVLDELENDKLPHAQTDYEKILYTMIKQMWNRLQHKIVFK